MKISDTAIQDARIIEIDRITDDRGFFARVWCQDEFARHGVKANWVQANVGYSVRAGTLRGMHYQRDPHAEAKLVRCTRGAVYDVALDLRPTSSSYLRWVGVTLDADSRSMLYIPEGCGHGTRHWPMTARSSTSRPHRTSATPLLALATTTRHSGFTGPSPSR